MKKLLLAFLTAILLVGCSDSDKANLGNFIGGPGNNGPGTTGGDPGNTISLPNISLPADFSLPDISLPADFSLPDFSLPADFSLPDFSLPADFSLPDLSLPADLSLPDFNPSDLGGNTEFPPISNQGTREAAVKIEDLEISYSFEQPDSLGMVYVNAQVKNNGAQPITNLYFSTKYTGSTESGFFDFPGTIMPGESSGMSTSFGPKSGNVADIQYDTFSYSIFSENDVIDVTYDMANQSYLAYSNADLGLPANLQPKATFDKLTVNNKLEAGSYGAEVKSTLTNSSTETISNVRVDYYSPITRQYYSFYFLGDFAPGTNSPEESNYLDDLETDFSKLTPLQIKYEINVGDHFQIIEYDYKLQRYNVFEI